jgi:hypothetical protein
MNNYQFTFIDDDHVLIDGIGYHLSDFHPQFRQALITVQAYATIRASAENRVDRKVADFTYELHKTALEQLWAESLCPEQGSAYCSQVCQSQEKE